MNESEENAHASLTVASTNSSIERKTVHELFSSCLEQIRACGSLSLTPNLKKKISRNDLLCKIPAIVYGMTPKMIVNDHDCIAPLCSIVCVGAVPFVPSRLFPASLPWMSGGRVAVLLKSWYKNDTSVLVIAQDANDPRGHFSGSIDEWPVNAVCHVENHVMIKRTAHCFNGFKWENPAFTTIKIVSWTAARRGVPETEEELDAPPSSNHESAFKVFCRNLDPAFSRLDLFTFNDACFARRLTTSQASEFGSLPSHVRRFEWLLVDIVLDNTLRKPYMMFLTNPRDCLQRLNSPDFLEFVNANLVHLSSPDFEQELFALDLVSVEPITEVDYDEFQKLAMLAVRIFLLNVLLI